MSRKFYLFIFVFLILLADCGCKKYPQGPAISLRSKKSRLSQQWKLTQYYVDDSERTVEFLQYYQTYQLNISKDGTMDVYTVSTLPATGQQHIVQTNGSWQFNDDKSGFVFTESYSTDNLSSTPIVGGTQHNYTLIKLYEKEMGYSEKINEHTYQYFYQHIE
jgi:hypothetical protein